MFTRHDYGRGRHFENREQGRSRSSQDDWRDGKTSELKCEGDGWSAVARSQLDGRIEGVKATVVRRGCAGRMQVGDNKRAMKFVTRSFETACSNMNGENPRGQKMQKVRKLKMMKLNDDDDNLVFFGDFGNVVYKASRANGPIRLTRASKTRATYDGFGPSRCGKDKQHALYDGDAEIEENIGVLKEREGANTQISKMEAEDDKTLFFLDSLDNYLILIETLSSSLRQGWLELASARHSMGASRVNTALLSLKNHSAATKVELDYDDYDGSTIKSPHFSLCKWTSTDDKNSSLEKQNIEEGEQLKENLSSWECVIYFLCMYFQKERAKVLSMFGTLVSPKLRASQLSFETALETLVELSNVRSSILKAHDAILMDMKKTTE
ncbi:hypothetical protein E3N88_00140 [Mikania micrantha]|uniref:Vacuolar ATPase assembly protein VMA22 n=1 Tax=Mikania micrantha TaxID=192012 RepID=A0A5N6PX79_9ASTR|nr:hypothetical protein E3N88_00140 [Mikania micrantha]